MSDRKNNTGNIVWLNDALEDFAPQGSSVLGISSIGHGLSLTIARYTEDGKSCTYTTEAEVVVDTETLLKCLLATIDKDTLVWAMQIPPQVMSQLVERLVSALTSTGPRHG